MAVPEEERHTLIPTPFTEQLSQFHDLHYHRFSPDNPVRIGTAAFFVTNEHFPETPYPDGLPKPDGYILGVGNGSIWSMLDLFPAGITPTGILAFDRDPSVILGGKILVEIAKRRQPFAESAESIFSPEPHDVMSVLAPAVAARERNPTFRSILERTIADGNFLSDRMTVKTLQNAPDYHDIRRRHTIRDMLERHWSTISELAANNRIFFAHMDIMNTDAVSFLADRLPNLEAKTNVVYTSNLTDRRYGCDLRHLRIFNPKGTGVYVYTKTKNDDYTLQLAGDIPEPPREDAGTA